MPSKPQTQLESWDKLQEEGLPDKRSLVYRVIRACTPPGAALFQVASVLGWPVHCVSGRITELAHIGYIRDSGKRQMNPATGRRAVIWIVCEAQPDLPGINGTRIDTRL